MRDAPLSFGDVLGMAGLVAFTASAVFLWSVSPADATPLVEDPPLGWSGKAALVALIWIVGSFLVGIGIGRFIRDGRGAPTEAEVIEIHEHAESRGGDHGR